MDKLKEELQHIEESLVKLREYLHMAEKESELEDLIVQQQDPALWHNQEELARIGSAIADRQEEVYAYRRIQHQLAEIHDSIAVLEDLRREEESQGEEMSGADALYAEVQRDVEQFKADVAQLEKSVFLGGKYDKGGALLFITAGAGGTEAQDWTEMLSRMYRKYAENRGWQVILLDIAYGQEAGVKNISLEIQGKMAYGYLKNESGVHRLVRLSPFNAKKLRHTSFALVEVLPIINAAQEITINPADLRVDTYRASGPGGQYVNKTESAIRITHIPTGITVACQSERLQGANRDHAMQMLTAKLWDLEQKKQEELKKSLKTKSEPMWGSQIRSYVLHPYKMIKDLRTGVEEHDTVAVLEGGKLDSFVEAELALSGASTQQRKTAA